jgi:hypothetical protein
MVRSLVRRVTLPALLISLSVLGSFLKLGLYAIAFDAAAGFVAALCIGPVAGGLVLAFGHLSVALLSGFPLTVPFHLLTALAMAGVGLGGGWFARRFGRTAGAVALVVGNGLVAPALLSLAPNPFGLRLFSVLALPLTLGAGANVAVALLVGAGLRRLGVVE